MKKIMFLIGSLGGGGAEKVLIDLVNSMPSNLYEITIISLFDEGIHKSELGRNIRYKGYIKTNSNFIKRVWLKIIFKYLNGKVLHRLIVKKKYDFEVAFLEGIPTKVVSGADESVKKYAWVHINLYNNFDSNRYYTSQKSYRDTYKKYDKIVCVSNSVKDGFCKRFGDGFPLIVKYNPIKPEDICSKAHEKVLANWNEKIVNLVSVGRIVDQKGYDRLVDAVEHLSFEYENFCIHILGEGNDRVRLSNLVKDKKIEEYIKFLGYCENPYPYIKKADVFLCSSREEGFSTVVTEALILGVPVVTTNCSGMEEQFDNTICGLIVDNSTEGIESGIRLVLTNQEILRKMRISAKERGASFTLESRMSEIKSLFSTE